MHVATTSTLLCIYLPDCPMSDTSASVVHAGYIDDVYGYDFAGDCLSDWRTNPVPGMTCGGKGSPQDTHSHGTHCAGIVGAVAGNGIGVAGIAPKVKLMCLKVRLHGCSCARACVPPTVPASSRVGRVTKATAPLGCFLLLPACMHNDCMCQLILCRVPRHCCCLHARPWLMTEARKVFNQMCACSARSHCMLPDTVSFWDFGSGLAVSRANG